MFLSNGKIFRNKELIVILYSHVSKKNLQITAAHVLQATAVFLAFSTTTVADNFRSQDRYFLTILLSAPLLGN
jgi:hypothetical protein